MSKIGIFCQKVDSYVKKEPPIYQLKEKHFEQNFADLKSAIKDLYFKYKCHQGLLRNLSEMSIIQIQ